MFESRRTEVGAGRAYGDDGVSAGGDSSGDGAGSEPPDWELAGELAGWPALAAAGPVDWEAPPGTLAGAEELLPGPTLAARLAALDVTTADGWDLVEAIRGFERLVSWATAGQLAAVAALARRPPAPPPPGVPPPPPAEEIYGRDRYGKDDFVVCEIAMALATSRSAAAARLARADELAELPDTFAGLRAGRLSVPKAYAIADALCGAELDLPSPAAVEARVLPRAPRQTPGQLRAALRRAVLAADPRAAERRHLRAVAERGLQIWEQPEGMAVLALRTLAPTVRRLFDTADVFAREAAPDDPRGVDARRVDALVDLIDTGTVALLDPATSAPDLPFDPPWSDTGPGPRAPSSASSGSVDETSSASAASGGGSSSFPAGPGPVPSGTRLRRRPRLPVRVALNVTVPVHTLLGLAEAPGELAGYGPLPAGLARALAFGPGSTWRRLLTDENGRLLEIAERTSPAPPAPTAGHDPGAALAEYVRLREGTCYAPGCRQPAHRCDLDHLVAHPEGRTEADNLYPRCRTHHRCKQAPGWLVTRDPDRGTCWTSPTGHVYPRKPHTLPVADPPTPRAPTPRAGAPAGPAPPPPAIDPPF